MRNPLPIDNEISRILAALKTTPNLVLTAAPGAGKTTRLPPELLQLGHRQIIVLEPRRIAAIGAAQRIADERDWQLGETVGYQVRFERKASRSTRVLFLTEALLLRKMISDPELKDVDAVVLDEFHERSITTDIALGALRELQELARPDLRIIVMSATLDPTPIANFLGSATVIDVPGKSFPLEIVHEQQSISLRTGPAFTERLAALIKRASRERTKGDILCFLPGRGEIERLQETLSPWAENAGFVVYALHGQLQIQEQKNVLSPNPQARKIVLATNVAESSLTVDGVSIVVDSGLARIAQIHPRTGFPSLELSRVPKSSLTQRAGRAARQGPGIVYRAWSIHDERGLMEFLPPEIVRSDLAETLLLLAALGVRNPLSFSWFQPPSEKAIQAAQEFLINLDALHSDGQLTKIGERIQKLPLPPRLGKALLLFADAGHAKIGAEILALLEAPGARVPEQFDDLEDDLQARWLEWQKERGSRRFRGLERAADQLYSLARDLTVKNFHPHNEVNFVWDEVVPILLLQVYPDRLCRRRTATDNKAVIIGGRGVRLRSESSVKKSEYFLALELGEDGQSSDTQIFQAIGLSEELLVAAFAGELTNFKRVEWLESEARFFVYSGRAWRGFAIGREHRQPATPEEVEENLLELVVSRSEELIQKHPALSAWFQRLQHFNRFHSKPIEWTAAKNRSAWEQACYGENSFSKILAKDLVLYFSSQLEAPENILLETEAPSHWNAPSGSKLPIAYTSDQGPLVEIRLQEIFGLAASPLVAGQPLTFVLLAPNYRPVQVTKDIASFWKNTYPEVRKELRARYPKHAWPDDPLTALPVAKGRPRKF